MNKLVFCGILIMVSNIASAISEYIYENDDLQISCRAIDFSRVSHLIEEEMKKLDPILKDAYMTKVVDTLETLKRNDLSNEELILVSCDLCSISDFLSEKMRKQLMNACLNLLIRAALKGNIDAMYDLTSTSFAPDQKDVKNILDIYGVDNLDYKQLIDELSQKLEERESKDSFVEVIKNIKAKSVSNSPVASLYEVPTGEVDSDSER